MRALQLSRLIAGSIFLSIFSVAHAANIQTFNSRTSWQAAAGGTVVTEDFADASLQPGFSFTAPSGVSGNPPEGPTNGEYAGAGLPSIFPNPGRLTFASGVNAFGGDWDLAPGGRGSGIVLVAVFANGTRQQIGVLANPSNGTFSGFFGFTSDVPVSAIIYQAGGLTGNSELFSLDDASYPAAVSSQTTQLGVTPQTTATAPHPTSSVAPTGQRPLVLGGGARANWSGNGSLLFRTRPAEGAEAPGWYGGSKDQWVPDPTSVTSFAIWMNDPGQIYDVQIFRSPTSGATAPVRRPEARATVGAGWTLTGGGCDVLWSATAPAAGNLLTGTFPDVRADGTADTWVCTARDHGGPAGTGSPSGIVAYAIGVRPRVATTRAPAMCVDRVTSGVSAHPSAQAGNCAAGRGVITGGGARAEWAGEIIPSSAQTLDLGGSRLRPNRQLPNFGGGAVSQLALQRWLAADGPQGVRLTATFPLSASATGPITGWQANAKDHMYSSPGTVTAYAISVVF